MEFKLKQREDGRWEFVGELIPMELARKSWDDHFAATRAANRAGYDVFANWTVREMEQASPGTH